MVTSKQADILVHGGMYRHGGWGLDALALVDGRAADLFLRKSFVQLQNA